MSNLLLEDGTDFLLEDSTLLLLEGAEFEDADVAGIDGISPALATYASAAALASLESAATLATLETAPLLGRLGGGEYGDGLYGAGEYGAGGTLTDATFDLDTELATLLSSPALAVFDTPEPALT